jgi:hypothetical protein
MLRKPSTIFAVTVLAVLSACGGRTANPVAQYQPGDENRSCEGLKVEVSNNEQEIAKLLPYEDATGKNVALGVTGAFFIVPLFFMDFKDAEGTEIQALKRRNNWLREVAARNQCDLPPPIFTAANRACSEAKNPERPWVGRWAAKQGNDVLTLELTQYQVNGQFITPSGVFQVNGRVDEKGEVEAKISSSYANGALAGTFPNLEARALDNAKIGSLETGGGTQFVLCS